MACFTLESLDSLRCVYPEETVLDFDLIGKSRCYRKGEIGRSVPGWQLGYPVFDRLLSMYAFYSKTKPVRVRITRSPGFEYVHTGNHTFRVPGCAGYASIGCIRFFLHPPAAPIWGFISMNRISWSRKRNQVKWRSFWIVRFPVVISHHVREDGIPQNS